MYGHEPTTWHAEITKAFAYNGESWADVESCTLSDAELLVKFDPGWGSVNGKPFTLWTAKRVYFPCTYDGSEWVDSVSRHPDGTATAHLGG